MLATSMAALDSSIVNVSLPVIQKEFGVGISRVEWVITAYMISFCLFIPLTNWLKSKIGYYNLFIYSLVIFTAGSLLCSLSHSLTILVVARIFQAIGGGAIQPTSLAILSENFPKEERGSAIGWWGIGNVMGPAIGPTLGGVLTHYLGWPSIFYINIPIGIITILLTVKYLRFLKDQPNSNPRFDLSGYVFFSLFIVLLQYGLALIAEIHTSRWLFITALTLSLVFLWFFIRSAKKAQPLIDLTVFKSKTFVNCSFIIIIRSLALYGGLFFIPFLFQGLMGYSEIESGLLLLPNALMMLIFRPLAGKLADRGIIRKPSLIGIGFVALSMAQLAFLGVGSSVWMIILAMVVRGFGMSLLVSPVSTALLNSVTAGQTATATSVNSLIQQVGGSIGIAISGILHVFVKQYFSNQGLSGSLSEHMALRYGFMVSAVIVLIAFLPAMKLPNGNVVKTEKLTGAELH